MAAEVGAAAGTAADGVDVAAGMRAGVVAAAANVTVVVATATKAGWEIASRHTLWPELRWDSTARTASVWSRSGPLT